MLGVIVDAEVIRDQARHAGGGPEFVVPAVDLGTLEQQAFQLLEVVVGQAGRRAGLWACVQSAWDAGVANPTRDALVMDAENTGDIGPAFAVLNECDGPLAAAFQLRG